ncbi:SRPBCC domain-containing protein [Nonomuraea sp. JJY05]|uniref:SRPBCC domain-containing protein n=1 Tax=Nonomuraea sp. JJY05 TaxID=3350255 RepID=UPI00373E27F2
MNPDLDLALERIIRAPRAIVWSAWTDPSRLERWWVPAPSRCRVDRLDLRPGGAFVTRLSDGGAEFVPHLDACFLAVDELERIVFTNAIDSAWRPASPVPVAMTATVTLDDHPDGTDYRIVVQHGDPEARAHHDKLGFAEGWGTATAQLAALAEGTP